MKRRDFFTLLGGAAAAWPLAARAQQPERMRHIGVLMPQAESDPEQRSWTTAFATRLRELGWKLIPFPVQSDAEIERAFAGFATEPNGAIIAIPTATVVRRREKIIALAAGHRLPAMYPYRFFVADGGLMSYGADLADLYRRAAFYIDRILKGAKPAELPVQQPTKFEFVINIKTAKALGLTVPPGLLCAPTR